MKSNSDQTENSVYQELAEKLFALEQRVAQLEAGKKAFNLPSNEEDDLEISFNIKPSDDIEYESSIGEYGLAWLGNVVLFLELLFLLNICGFRDLT